MFSVTKRIEVITQPRLGYVPMSSMNVAEYAKCEFNKVNPYFKPIQGMVVDYLTRFTMGADKQEAFKISLMGADIVGESDKARSLLNEITGLDPWSIGVACRLTGYDVALRMGPEYFTPIEKMVPPSKDLIYNIRMMVYRACFFLEKHGPIVLNGFTFEGGYNDIISSGDGDYLTADTLWDLKVSEQKPTSKHTLQILVYYILGLHSVHREFDAVKYLGIYNPELNTAYTISLSDIPDDVFYLVSRDVIGYSMPEDPKNWRRASGTSEEAYDEACEYILRFLKSSGAVKQGSTFSPEKYDDGIHDITIEDYWSYYSGLTGDMRFYGPKFTRTSSVKFIKNSGFMMFVSISNKGKPSVLHGGTLRRLHKPLEYYYDNLPEYANAVLEKFSGYWNALYSIAKQLPGEGKVHGCIVDISFSNHIYLNPYDGTVVPYSAPSMYEKYVYKNVASLMTAEMPELLPAFNRAIEDKTNKELAALVSEGAGKNLFPVIRPDEINTSSALVTDTDMYGISNRIKVLQMIRDHHLVAVWCDSFLNDKPPLPVSK